VSAETQDPAPQGSQGQPPVGEAQGTANNQVSADDQRGGAGVGVADNHQEPASQMEGGSGDGGDEEQDEEVTRFWAKLKEDPFAVVLTIATAILAIATVVLAGATVGLWRGIITLTQQPAETILRLKRIGAGHGERVAE
jgi:hypothetical protein